MERRTQPRRTSWCRSVGKAKTSSTSTLLAILLWDARVLSRFPFLFSSRQNISGNIGLLQACTEFFSENNIEYSRSPIEGVDGTLFTVSRFLQRRYKVCNYFFSPTTGGYVCTSAIFLPSPRTSWPPSLTQSGMFRLHIQMKTFENLQLQPSGARLNQPPRQETVCENCEVPPGRSVQVQLITFWFYPPLLWSHAPHDKMVRYLLVTIEYEPFAHLGRPHSISYNAVKELFGSFSNVKFAAQV